MSIHDSAGSPPVATHPTRLIAYSVALAALAVALSPISIPTGIAKLSPTQHFINVIAGALVGPWLMGKDIALSVLILPFLLSSAAGAALGIVGLRVLQRLGYLR